MEEHSVQADLRLLRDQVDRLQIEAAEKKRPWYRQLPSLLSLAAFVFSIFTAVLSQFQSSQADIRSKKEEMRKLLDDLVRVQSEFQDRVIEIKDPAKREIASALLNTRHGMYLEATEVLASQIPKAVSSSEYGILASEKSRISDFKKAEVYQLRAIEAARDPITKCIAYRALATLYFWSPLRDFAKGRKAFEDAVSAVAAATDDYSLYVLGYTYESWGFGELSNGFRMEGWQRIDRARKYYNDMSASNPLRKWALEPLEARIKQQQPR
jgi:hypothetical protein